MEEMDLLKQQVHYLRSIIDSTGDSFFLIDRKGRIVDVNDAYVELIGYSREELIGMSMAELDTIESPADVQGHVSKVFDQGRDIFETRHRRKDGSEVPIEISTSFVDLAGGHLISFGRDLTERMHQMERIELLVEMLEAAPGSISIHDTRGHFLYANRETLRQHGYASEDEFLSLTLADLDTPDSAAKMPERMRELLERGEHRFEVEHYRKDGTTVPMDVTCKLITWKNETAILSMALDISDRRMAESKLRASEERFRSFVENANDIVFSLDLDGRITYMSPNWLDYMGEGADDALGKSPFEDYVLPEHRAHTLESFRKVVESGQKQTTREYALRKPDGGVSWHISTAAPLFDSDGKIFGMVGIARDVSAERKREQERRELQEQLAQAQKMESVGRLAGGIAHDFNNLLMGIMGYADLCLDEVEEGEPIRGWLEEIMREARRSAGLTQQLLAFASKQTVQPKVIDLNATVESMLKMLRRLIGEEIDLVWKPGGDLKTINFDPRQIDQILANLCVNARDAIAANGEIVIETFNLEDGDSPPAGRNGDFVALKVSDNGCGFDQEVASRLFEPFFTTKDKYKGSGLGLPMVYGILKQNKGEIRVQSSPGKGASFEIIIPAAQGGPNLSEKEEHELHGTDMDGKTVLLVEDEESVRLITKSYLEKLGHHVVEAALPSQALKIYAERGDIFDLLLSDVIMPGMSGPELAGKIQADNQRIKVLYMSGHTAEYIAERGFVEDGVQLLSKPATRSDLARKLSEVFGE